jgi:hypothetical protein
MGMMMIGCKSTKIAMARRQTLNKEKNVTDRKRRKCGNTSGTDSVFL